MDNGLGFHVGVNPHWEVSPYFAIEGQISYAFVDISGTFISGKTGSLSVGNALAGGRLYFRSDKKNIRPYINFLVGGMYYRKVREDQIETNPVLGLSAGAFIEINRFVAGLSFETPANLVLKAGYAF